MNFSAAWHSLKHRKGVGISSIVIITGFSNDANKNAAAGVLSFELRPLSVKRQSLPLEVEVGRTVRAHALRRLKGDSLNTFAKRTIYYLFSCNLIII